MSWFCSFPQPASVETPRAHDSPWVLRFRFVLPFEDNSRKALLAGQHWIKAPPDLL